MAHPKEDNQAQEEISVELTTRLQVPQIAKDSVTGELHLYHRAHWYEGKLYYRGQVLIDSTEAAEIIRLRKL